MVVDEYLNFLLECRDQKKHIESGNKGLKFKQIKLMSEFGFEHFSIPTFPLMSVMNINT